MIVKMKEIKYECELIRDLLPLYQDGVCSQSSQKAVEEHLKNCCNCAQMAERLKNYEVDEVLIKEKNNVLTTHEKKERRKTVTIGMITAGVLFVPVIVCLICNLAIGHALNWFFIVLSSLILVASITVLPLVAERKKWIWTIFGFTCSLLFLLLTCCIYTGGSWFLVAAAGSILGLSVLLAPYVVGNIPLPRFLQNKKGLVVMIWDTVWIYLLIAACGIFVKGEYFYWHTGLCITTYCLWLPWFVFVVCRYFKMDKLIKSGLIVIAGGVYTAFTNDVICKVTGINQGGSIFDADMITGGTIDRLEALNGNILLTVLILSVLAGGILILAGLKKKS